MFNISANVVKYSKLISFLLAFVGTWVILLGLPYLSSSSVTNTPTSASTQEFQSGRQAAVGEIIKVVEVEASEPILAEVVKPANLAPEPDSGTFKIMIAGDVMLDRYVRKLAEQNGYDSLFTDIAPLLHTADLAVVNLEGPITNFPSKTLLPNGSTTPELVFTFSPATAPALARAGIDLVSLANNHTDNFGLAGFEQTKEYLKQTGLSWFANPWNSRGDSKTVCQKGICVAFVGYHEFREGFDNVLAEVRALDPQVDLVIVMPHWGEEYVPEPSERLKTKARQLVTAGADLIVGAHPHVVMSKEKVNGVPVFYSLGNFLFDQYFSVETMNGELLEIDLVRDEATDQAKISQILIHGVSTVSRTGVTLTNNVDSI
jgi:poly-gamma-glutamate synthesis protein (capsule biosynthesis protein)